MKKERPYLAAAFAAIGILAAIAATARAETATLEAKRLASPGQAGVVAASAENLYRSTSPQSFNSMVQATGNNRIAFPGMNEQESAFKKLVKKEPKYQSEYPFRGVAKLGSQEYPFVLDAVPEKPKAKKEKSEAEKSKPAADKEKKDADEEKSDTSEGRLGVLTLSGEEEDADEKKADADDAKAKEKEKTPQPIRYNRLYFDLNHNGDLTDDGVIEAQASPSMGSYVSFSFPQVDLTVDAGGTPVEYSFTMRGYMNAQKEFSYAGVQLYAAAYREGNITLDGKEHHLVLIDFNSNGRYDDQIAVITNGNGPEARVYPQQGDMLLIDPDPKIPDSPYDPAGSRFRNYVSKLVNIEGRYYDLKITPAGDKVTLEPSAVPLGNVTNPNDGFSAVIYGDQGFLKISGGKEHPASVPAGEWKLLSYSIDLTESPEASKPAEEKPKSEDQAENKTSTPKVFSTAIRTLLAGSPAAAVGVARRTVVAAQANAGYKAVKVVAGETVEMPFGPPYKPVVTSYQSVDAKQKPVTQLSLSLVGSAGESCTNMTVKGDRPPKPTFEITDAEGKVVQSGSFEYG